MKKTRGGCTKHFPAKSTCRHCFIVELLRQSWPSTTISTLAILALVGCTSVIKRADGTWDVPGQVERRSVFGSNQSGLLIDNCKKEVVRWWWENRYEECTEKVGYQFASSPGVGGPIVNGMLVGLGLGLGLAHSGSTQTNNMDVRASTVNPPVVKK